MTDAMTDDMTMQSPANLTDRNVDRIASSPQALFDGGQDASAARLRQGGRNRGRTTAFLSSFGRFQQVLTGL
jgi:hypothetical protein